jgi:hypothetical protein
MAPQEDLLSSLETTLGHEARLVRHAGLAYTEARGRAGLEAVERALSAYFSWRTSRAAAGGTGGLQSIVESWGTAELLAINPQGWGELTVSDAGLQLRVTSAPELRHYAGHGVLPFAALHYGALGRELAKGAGLGGAVEVRQDGEVLHLTVGAPDTSSDAARPGVAAEGDAGRRLLRATSENRGALIVFLGREADNAFGADGEEMFRSACRAFGAERGSAMRLSHLSNDLSLDLVSMMELYDSGGNTNVWEYRDEGTLTPREWSQDCTFCPFVQSWHDLDGLRYGYIYDHEFHYAQFKAYRRDIEVRWGELMSRGDATCEFRFSIPDEVGTPGG